MASDQLAPLTRRGVPTDPNLRILALGTVVNRAGSGALVTTFALFFTRKVGLEPAQVGLALSIGAVVPARCAVRMPGTLDPSAADASVSSQTVTMRCTRGTLPSGSRAGSRAVGPRISRDLVSTTIPLAPRPLADTTRSGPPATASRLVITVNF